jgi:methionyl-tRNA formyltransferase
MKFVYFGYDFMLPAVQRLVEEGHELAAVLSFECDNVFNFNTATREFAEGRGLPFTLSRAEPAHIETYLSQGVQVFLAAGYPYKVPPIPADRAYGINLHPSHLPKGRGIMPTPHIILGQHEAAGITIHKMTERFDYGDILLQEKFEVGAREDVEIYSARIALKAPDMLSRVFRDLPEFWENALAQSEVTASHFKAPDEAMRTFRWDMNIEEIDRIARAFGRYGSLTQLGEERLVVYNLAVWAESHSLPPGTLAAVMSRELVVAAKGGFVVLKEFQKI